MSMKRFFPRFIFLFFMGFLTLVFSLESVIGIAYASPREGAAYTDAAKKKKKTKSRPKIYLLKKQQKKKRT